MFKRSPLSIRKHRAAARGSAFGLSAQGPISFMSLRSARSFARGYVCVDRVVADRGPRHLERFVVCHPRTAKSHRWNQCWPGSVIRNWRFVRDTAGRLA